MWSIAPTRANGSTKGYDKDGKRDVIERLAPEGLRENGRVVDTLNKEPSNRALYARFEHRAVPIALTPALPKPKWPKPIDAGHSGHQRCQRALNGLQNSPNISPGTFNRNPLATVAASVASPRQSAPGGPPQRIDSVVFNRDQSSLGAVLGRLDAAGSRRLAAVPPPRPWRPGWKPPLRRYRRTARPSRPWPSTRPRNNGAARLRRGPERWPTAPGRGAPGRGIIGLNP